MAGPQPRGNAIDESLRSRFEAAWREGRPEPIERFLPGENDLRYLPALEELIRIELHLAWESWSTRLRDGSAEPHHQTLVRPSQLEEYLERFPKLNRPEIVLRLIHQERSARNAHGEDVSLDEYRRRFPALEIADQPPRPEPPMPGEPHQDTQRTEALPTGQLADQPPRSELPMLSEPGLDTQQAAATGGAPGETPSVSSLETFGNYESLEEIGRGGMGVVYRARQRSANRTVALKVIRRDRLEALPRDTHTSALERFRQEAQAAARLEHENIVTVYEVGEVDRQPFFSMRYVDGRSLSQILRDGPMGNRKAAKYLEPVARALHEAHTLGILHRDLKPQNILVDKKTDRALVADFGLAKLTEGQEELTREGEVMGTPPYMSPEQAKDSASVTAQTDVYALGATLYHVLTGRPPFQAANPLETLRQVIDEEAAPPRQLNPSIDRDLETVCLKCLEKEPTRRYDSAHALADDLQRYLNAEPILARPISAFGRVVRWCRRKPALATAISVAFLAGNVALVASTLGYIKTAAALNEKTAALKQSEQSLASLRAGVEDFYTLVAQHTLLNEPGMENLRQELLEKAQRFYDDIRSRGAEDPKSRSDVAESYFHLGRIHEELKRRQEALGFYTKARNMQQKLLAEEPDKAEHRQALGHTLAAMGAAWHNQKKLEEARKAHKEALDVRERLVEVAEKEKDPELNEYRRTLANGYMNFALFLKDNKQFTEARKKMNLAQGLRREILKDGEDPETRRDLGMGYYNLATLAILDKDVQKARRNLDLAIEQFKTLLEKSPEHVENQRHLALCYQIRGRLNSDSGDRDSAIDDYQKALDRTQTLVQGNRLVSQLMTELAALSMSKAQLEKTQEKPQAFNSFQRARDILEALTVIEKPPKVLDCRLQLGEAYLQLAELEEDPSAALRCCQQTRLEFETIWQNAPSMAELQKTGQLQSDLEQVFTARTRLVAANRRVDGLLADFPDEPNFLAESHSMTEALLKSAQRVRDALSALSEENKRDPRYRQDLAMMHCEIGSLHLQLEQPAKARVNLQEAEKHLQDLLAKLPKVDEALQNGVDKRLLIEPYRSYKLLLGETYMLFGRLEASEKHPKAALKSYQQARQEFEALWKYATSAAELGDAGQLEAELAQLSGTRIQLEAAKKHVDELGAESPNSPEFGDESRAMAAALLESFQRRRRILEALIKRYDEAEEVAPPAHRRDLAVTLREIGCLQLELKHPQAPSTLETARDRLLALVDEFPKNHDYRMRLAEVCFDLAWVEQSAGRLDAALEAYQQVCQQYESVWRHAPTPDSRVNLAWALRLTGQLETKLGRLDDARTHLNAAQTHLEELRKTDPENQAYLSESEATQAALNGLEKAQHEQP